MTVKPLPLETASASMSSAVTALERNLSIAIKGKDESIQLLLTALLAGGHVLLEDVPGTGKTTLAKALARSIDGLFRRVQFTPDLLPADITGSSFYRPQDGTFEFREGPIFTNILLADEINRTSPRTQSALLEVMSENQISIEGLRRGLPQPFFVIATQNPAEFHGTYPLPEAQLDRFAVRISLGYPTLDDEMDILYSHASGEPVEMLEPVLNCEDIIALQRRVRSVTMERSVADYLLRIVEATRKDARLRLAASPRASISLFHMAQARALLSGRDFVVPEDVRSLAVPVLSHRVMLDTKSRYGGATGEQIVHEILESLAVPR